MKFPRSALLTLSFAFSAAFVTCNDETTNNRHRLPTRSVRGTNGSVHDNDDDSDRKMKLAVELINRELLIQEGQQQRDGTTSGGDGGKRSLQDTSTSCGLTVRPVRRMIMMFNPTIPKWTFESPSAICCPSFLDVVPSRLKVLT